MNTKKFGLLALLFFGATLVLLAVLDIQRTQAPAFGKISDEIYVFPDTSKRSLFSLSGIISDIISHFTGSNNNSYENVCLNGQDPSSMGTQQQLLEFIQGPCLPVILSPGFTASKLQVNIDCETLQSENPDIFSSCGWETCSSWNVLSKSPADSYTIWISDFVGPLSIILNSTVTCWSNLIQMQINASATDLTTKYISPAGANVVVKSSTTDNQEQCGLSAQDNMFPSPVQQGGSVGFEDMKNALLGMGYQLGLTLYGAPYDWRKTTVANGIGDILNNTVQQIHNLTGKPTVLVAHSLGNFGALYFLNTLPAEQKKYVANFVSLMNPLSGVPNTAKGFMGGDPEFYFGETFGHSFGMTLEAKKKFFSASTGNIDVFVKDPFTYFAGQQWMQDWEARVQLESQFNASTEQGQEGWQAVVDSGNYTYQWFPTPLEQCFQGFLNRSDQCGMHMYNWSAVPIVTVQNDSFTASTTDIAELFDTYVETTEIGPEMFADCLTNNVYKLLNPGVPTTIVYGSHLYTTKAFHWDYDPRPLVENGQYALPNTTDYSQGDDTVPTTSSLLTALKWSWEFDNKEQAGIPNAQPVKTVEVCSIYNNKGTIYDVTNSDAPYGVSNNEYIGVGCDCQPAAGSTTVGDKCDHAAFLADSVLIQFIQTIVNANYNNTNYQQTGAYLLNDTSLNQVASNCPSVNYGPSVYFSLLNKVSE